MILDGWTKQCWTARHYVQYVDSQDGHSAIYGQQCCITLYDYGDLRHSIMIAADTTLSGNLMLQTD
jgi:hypothetical protein